MSRLRPSFLPRSNSTSRTPARAARRGLAAAITGLALLAGVGSGAVIAADPASALPAAPAPAAPASAAAASPQPGGTLTWLVTPEPSTIAPLTTTAGGSADIGPKILEGLLTFDFDLTPKPLLATAWKVSADGLRYEFTLRQGVLWHDGKPFTADDVVFSITTLKEVHPRGRSTFANVKTVTATDAHTVALTLGEPAPYLLTALSATESPIVPKHLYDGRDIATNPHNNAPVGTGPFRFQEFVRGSHITLVRNETYWDKPRPYLERIVVRIIADGTARSAALESGEAQLSSGGIPLSDIKRFQALPRVILSIDPRPYLGDHQQIYLNLDAEPFKKVEVRRAIHQAFDIDAFNKTVWWGHGVPSASPIGVASPFHDPAITRVPYDPKAAEAALDAAGYPRRAGGHRFDVRVLYNPFQERRAADFFRQSLQRVGVNAHIEALDFATYVQRAYTDRAFDITLENQVNMFDPTLGVQRVFWSKNFKVGLPFSNAPHYVNPEVDQLLEAAAREPDFDKRKQSFLRFQEIIARDLPSLELGANPNVIVADRRLRDFNVNAEGIRGSFSTTWFARP